MVVERVLSLLTLLTLLTQKVTHALFHTIGHTNVQLCQMRVSDGQVCSLENEGMPGNPGLSIWGKMRRRGEE